MATPDLTARNALSGLMRAIRGEPDRPAKGLRTAADWASAWGCSWNTANRRIRAAVARRAWERRVYMLPRSGGALVPTPHYGPKHKGAMRGN